MLQASEHTQVATDNVKAATLPVDVSGIAVTIDSSGVHLNAQVCLCPVNVPATASVIAGTCGGPLVRKTRELDLGPVPGGVKDQLVALADFAGAFPLVADRVALRGGCAAVIGTTP